MTTDDLLTRPAISIMKAAELTGVSRRTIYNWLDAGHLEYIRTAGGRVRIFVDTLFRYGITEADGTRRLGRLAKPARSQAAANRHAAGSESL